MRTAIFLSVILLFLSCSGNNITGTSGSEREYEPGKIYGTVAGLPGRKILLYSLYGDQVSLIDSAMADPHGNFEFHFPEERAHGMYRIAMGRSTLPGHYDQHRQQADLIWDGNTIAFSTHYTAPGDSMKVIRSEENRMYYNFFRRMEELERRMNVVSTALVDYPPGDNFYRRLQRQHRRIQNRRANYIDNLVKKNRGMIVASIARFHKMPRISSPAEREGMEQLKSGFFFREQFADPVLLHTDLIPRRIIRYLSLYAGNGSDDQQRQEEMTGAVDIIMTNAAASQEVYYFVLEFLMNGFGSMGMDLVVEHLNDRYLTGGVCFEEGRVADGELPVAAGGLTEGDRVPGFSLTGPDGISFDLDDIDAGYTLLVFWGSWCPYCENVMDDLWDLYSDLRKREAGFLEVVAIGLEDDRRAWQDIISMRGWDWINYSSLQKWDCPIARAYRIAGTPTMILLDSEKRFVSEPVRVRALGRHLSAQMD